MMPCSWVDGTSVSEESAASMSSSIRMHGVISKNSVLQPCVAQRPSEYLQTMHGH